MHSPRAGILLALTIILTNVSTGWAQPSVLVARNKLQSKTENGTVTRAEVGEVVTLIEQKGERYRVLTQRGFRGWVRLESVVPLKDAAPLYGQLIRQSPDDARLYQMRGNVWAARGEAEKAVADYGRAIKLAEPNPELYLRRGVFLIQMQKHDAAIADFDHAAKLGAKGPPVHANRAAALMAKEDYTSALSDYTILIELSPDKPDWYVQRGIANRRAGKWEDAIGDFSRAIELAPDNLSAIGHRGFAYYRIGEHTKAVEDFSEVIRLNPEDAVAYNNRGFNRQSAGDYKGAQADYRKAIELAPEYPLALQNMAWFMTTCPDEAYRDGKAALQTAKRLCELRRYQLPSDLKALAAAHAELGDFKSAVEYQTKVVKLTEGDAQTEEQEILRLYTTDRPFRSPNES